ncbi:unnamed protein product [Calicophoron daubneyi]|uniref:LIM zinc-binding domain-containing protein n=1 Tax=Calicophoron daubneyi TaxID=300641 RepID=A0AAV2TQW1_CALDB
MSQRPFGSGGRQGRWDNYSYERAGPRMTGSAERRYHHPVVPISSTAAPLYTRASELYPMRTSSERDNVYRYKPGSGSLGASGRPNSPSSGQAIVIPVLHLGANRAASSPGSLVNIGMHTGGPNSESSPAPSDISEPSNRSPSYRTSSVVTTGSRAGNNRSLPHTNDTEAEVDALTNLLMQSMETKSSSSGIGSSGGLASGVEGASSSPVGSLKRGSVPSGASPSSQIGRLQQHIGMKPGSGNNLNGGRGSPLTVGAATNAPGSPSNNSPTSSTSSIHNASDTSSTGNTVTSPIPGQSTCFRCRRALLPPEGSTLNPGLAVGNSNNVVTLTGALNVKLHVACFTCYRCAAPLKTDAYYHSLRRLLCPTCVRDGAVETCTNCHRPIGDRIVHALGSPYHPNCFVCVVCGGRLDSKPFTIDVNGRLHCLEDFHRRYAPRCAVCGRPIAPDPGSQEARRVVSGDSNYHLECFGVQTTTQPAGLSSKSGKFATGVTS